MQRYEYKIVPAPRKGRKGPQVKGAEARFAHGLEMSINTLAAEGWEYVRADVLPSEERQGLTSSQVIYRSVLVFRRMTRPDTSQMPVAPVEDTSPSQTEDTNGSDSVQQMPDTGPEVDIEDASDAPDLGTSQDGFDETLPKEPPLTANDEARN